MNIQSVSTDKKEAIIRLNADDLVIICNALYSQLNKKKDNKRFLELYGDMMMARDLCQYGHVDSFCLGEIVKCHSELRGIFTGWRY